ncbi:MAG: hypothetical protein KGY69_09285 [Bacteroidales bacterium]|nr:hypothetical protein [Bacteroidales bacterium]
MKKNLWRFSVSFIEIRYGSKIWIRILHILDMKLLYTQEARFQKVFLLIKRFGVLDDQMKVMMKERKWFCVLSALVVSAAAGLKLWLMFGGKIQFNADEAIVALMAKHINRGEFPLFFYGQSYMGSLDAMFIALGFRIFGEEVWVIRLVQSMLFVGTVWTAMRVAYLVFGSRHVALLSGLFLALPNVNVALYTTVSLGGYGEALLLGNMILIIGLRIGKKVEERVFDNQLILDLRWLIWGVLAGLGLWVFGLTLVYTIPMGIYLMIFLYRENSRKKTARKMAYILGGGVLGSAPWWIYALKNGWRNLIYELTGSAIANIQQIPSFLKPFVRLYRFLLLGSTVSLGLRPPWNVNWLLLPLIPFILIFWCGVLAYTIKSFSEMQQNQFEKAVMVGIFTVTIAGFIFTPFGSDPSGRYFLPLALPLSLFAADMIVSISKRNQSLAVGLTVLVLFFNVGGIVQSSVRSPHGLTTQFDKVTRIDHEFDEDLIGFLREHELKRGYTNYWVSYPLAFLSQEELLYVPQLPYHHDFRYTTRDNRYAPYQEMVEEADAVAYITTNHPPLDEYLVQKFAEKGIQWEYEEIGDYHIYYQFSKLVRPADIDLGSPKKK